MARVSRDVACGGSAGNQVGSDSHSGGVHSGNQGYVVRDVLTSPYKPIRSYHGGDVVGNDGSAMGHRRPISAPSDFIYSIPEATLGRLRTVEASFKHSLRLGGRGTTGGSAVVTMAKSAGGGAVGRRNSMEGVPGIGQCGRGGDKISSRGVTKLLRPLSDRKSGVHGVHR